MGAMLSSFEHQQYCRSTRSKVEENSGSQKFQFPRLGKIQVN